jgi:DNA-binding helix-hairpin-helix protein with protein kinase domain
MNDLALRSVRDNDGRELTIVAEPLARGGEGTIHRIAGHPGELVKIYYDEPDPDRVAKLRAMIACGTHELREAAAWPTQLIVEGAGANAKAIGLLMPEVIGHREIHQLYSPVERKRHFPEANWKMLALAASNLGRVVSAVHSAGCVIGDLNQNNVLVSQRATVRLIDCDSFQFRLGDAKPWTCDVGKEEYLPPELQSANLRGLVREIRHDDFALAVIVFQLMFMGRHPFSGRHSRSDDFGIGAAIAEGAYFYGRDAAKRGFAPPPGVITTAELPAEVADAFEQAFRSQVRPTSAQWAGLMLDFARQTIACDKSPRHVYHPSTGRCPWCALKNAYRVDFFPEIAVGAFAAAGASSSTDFEIDADALLRLVEAIPRFDRTYVRPKIAKKKLRTPLPAPSELTRPDPPEFQAEPDEPAGPDDHAALFLIRALAWPTLLAGVAGLAFGNSLAAPILAASGSLFVLRAIVARAIAKSQYADWLKRFEAVRTENEAILDEWNATHAEWLAEADRRMRRRDEILARLVDREQSWKNWLETLRTDDENLRAEAATVHLRLKRRLADYRQALDDQNAARRNEAVEAWLEGHLIRDAKIPQIGRTRVAMLASFGIETAADVVRLVQAQNYAIPGFGQRLMNNLWYWAADVQSRFDPAAFAQLPTETVLKIKARFEPEVRSLVLRMNQIAEELATFEPAVVEKSPRVMRFFEEMTRLYLEADADVRIMQ